MWPFTTSYPVKRAEEIDGKTFDYVVVGGGTAGCVLASRLSELDFSLGGGRRGTPPPSVLVLEKGEYNDGWIFRIPLIGQDSFMAGLGTVTDRWSQPISEAFGKRMRLLSADTLGGTSRVNATIVTRGPPGGYNEWAEEMGLEDWGWKKVEPYWRKMETDLSHPADPGRGHDGPMQVRQFNHPQTFYQFMAKACLAAGLPVLEDCNTPGAPAQGYFHLDLAIDKQGYRSSLDRSYLSKKIASERRDRLAVCTGVAVTKLKLDAAKKQVRGVHFRENGRDFFVKARREVIICSGALRTPQLLMLSGIGPKEQLQKHGITVLHDLPAVGQNLQDHVSFSLNVQAPLSHTIQFVQTILGGLWHFLLYIFLGKGFLSHGSTPYSIFLRTTALNEDDMTIATTDPNTGEDAIDAASPRNIPNVEVMMTPINALTVSLPGTTQTPVVALLTCITQPVSKGTLTLASSDPAVHPIVRYPFLQNDHDKTTARTAIRFSMRMAGRLAEAGYPHPCPLIVAPGVNDHLTPPRGTDVYTEFAGAGPGEKEAMLRRAAKLAAAREAAVQAAQGRPLEDASGLWDKVTDEQIDEFAKRSALTTLHYSCTCRMSRTSRNGVVDQRLRVHGWANLRIADTSVFPKIPSAHTMMPVMMVAERCADFLKEEWRARKVQ